ncbi:MAG: DUF1501 domain-containing protein [Betaproteobacteria bacterium]
MQTTLTRRAGLRLLGAAGAFLPLRMVFAAPVSTHEAAGPRLVVVMLRGALDGLAAVPARGDPAWSALRTDEDAAAGALPLDATFSMHPALSNLHRWYTRKELLVVHATASPYRERSHFDAQQLLESGGERPFVLSTGWLGRALQTRDKRAVAITAAMPLALRGADGASTWTPDRQRPVDQDLMSRVALMYRGDGPLAAAFGEAAVQKDMAMDADGGPGLASLARQAGIFLADPNGPRVAWLEAGGWDTHANQHARLGRLLDGLDEALAALREGLGAQWANTTVLVMTEFGRSARFNGSGGTDHGTGGVAFLAGGGVAGGTVLTDWPGLAGGQLFEGRDLKPTIDLRSVMVPIVQRQFGLDPAQIQSNILPGAIATRHSLWRT